MDKEENNSSRFDFGPGVELPARVSMSDIIIKQVDNGYIVMVGYKMLVFESRGRLLEGLERYMRNPAEYRA